VAFNAAAEIPVIRKIVFNAPKAGTATVMFHGNMYCAGPDTSLGGTYRGTRVDFISQIVDRNVAPELAKPGSLRHAAGLETFNAPSYQWSTTFNLASTRVFPIAAAGTQRYFFTMTRLLQDANMTCYVYTATFTVLFTP
jgi:hypothetical protein